MLDLNNRSAVLNALGHVVAILLLGELHPCGGCKVDSNNLCFVLQYDPNPYLLAKLALVDVVDGLYATFDFSK
jgi:hypothetical protein